MNRTDTDFFETEPAEVDVLVAAALGEIRAEPDPTVRYIMATRQQQLYAEVVNAAGSIRAEAAAALHRDGLSYRQIADHLGVTRARAQQLVEHGRDQ